MSITKVAQVTELLREADRLTAQAASLIADGAHDTALPLEFSLRLDARNTRWAASELATISEHLRHMPHLRCYVVAGLVSWSQCRAIVRAMRDLRVASHAQIDELIAPRADALAAAEPDRLVTEVEDLCARLRLDLVERREQRAIDRSFLLVRPNLFGGGTLYGEADAERFAAIVGALDHEAEAPSEDVSRPEQLMDALVGVCEASLAGSNTTRPQPRVIALLDSDGGKVLWNLPGQGPQAQPANGRGHGL